MGQATGKTFVEYMDDRGHGGGAQLAGFINGVAERSRVLSNKDGKVQCTYDPPPRLKRDGTVVNPPPFPFEIGDDQHGFPDIHAPEFHRFAGYVGMYLDKGGTEEGISDPYHDDEE